MICRPKDQGGLGIEVLDIKNNCLLSKWLFKIINGEGMWQELLMRERPLGSSILTYLLQPKNKMDTRSQRSPRLIRVRIHL
jgi:hypothetical protein